MEKWIRKKYKDSKNFQRLFYIVNNENNKNYSYFHLYERKENFLLTLFVSFLLVFYLNLGKKTSKKQVQANAGKIN